MLLYLSQKSGGAPAGQAPSASSLTREILPRLTRAFGVSFVVALAITALGLIPAVLPPRKEA